MTSQFSEMALTSIFFDVDLFYIQILVTAASFISISPLVLQLWHFSFIRDLTRNPESGKPPSEFCLISKNWGKSGTTNLARMFLIKYYWMPQNTRVSVFTVSELLRENQQYPLTLTQVNIEERKVLIIWFIWKNE